MRAFSALCVCVCVAPCICTCRSVWQRLLLLVWQSESAVCRSRGVKCVCRCVECSDGVATSCSPADTMWRLLFKYQRRTEGTGAVCGRRAGLHTHETRLYFTNLSATLNSSHIMNSSQRVNGSCRIKAHSHWANLNHLIQIESPEIPTLHRASVVMVTVTTRWLILNQTLLSCVIFIHPPQLILLMWTLSLNTTRPFAPVIITATIRCCLAIKCNYGPQ